MPSSRITAALTLALGGVCSAGPYSRALNDPSAATDAPVPGFVGPEGTGRARLDTFQTDGNGDPIYQNPRNFTNPLFFAWAETVTDYQRSDADASFDDPSRALGSVTGDAFDVVALGELNAAALAAGSPPGTITLELAKPVRDLTGADFVIFENGAIAQYNYGGAGVGGIFGELAYVEVSANGVDFVRFPCASLTATAVGSYGSIDPTNVRNLAGKHVNAYGDSWGTPFDLAEVGLSQITHIRLVDIPGNGSRLDSAGNPIRDPWTTFGSGGFDLEAVGAISTLMTFDAWPALASLPAGARGMNDDPDADGLPNLLEYAFARVPWLADAADAAPAFRMVAEGGSLYPEISFLRDERLADLTYEVQSASSLTANDWTTLARSSAGAAMQPAIGHQPSISETSATGIASVGVIRRVTLRDEISASGSGPRFYRVKVSSTP